MTKIESRTERNVKKAFHALGVSHAGCGVADHPASDSVILEIWWATYGTRRLDQPTAIMIPATVASSRRRAGAYIQRELNVCVFPITQPTEREPAMDATGPETEQVTNKLMDEEAEHAERAKIQKIVDGGPAILKPAVSDVLTRVSVSAIHREALDMALRLGGHGNAASLIHSAQEIEGYLSGAAKNPFPVVTGSDAGYNRGVQDSMAKVIEASVSIRPKAELLDQLTNLIRQ